MLSVTLKLPSSLPLHLFFLPPQTLLSSSETHRRSAWAQSPQTRRRQPMLGRRLDPFRPLFSIFGVSALYFGLCLCFGFVFRVVLVFQLCVSSWVFVSSMGFCFELDLCFELWFFCFLFLFFFTGFDGHDKVVVVQWFLWVWWWLWLCWWLNEILFYYSVYIILLC